MTKDYLSSTTSTCVDKEERVRVENSCRNKRITILRGQWDVTSLR